MTLVFAQGMVAGAWNYVIASYVITWLFLIGYTVQLLIRGRNS